MATAVLALCLTRRTNASARTISACRQGKACGHTVCSHRQACSCLVPSPSGHAAPARPIAHPQGAERCAGSPPRPGRASTHMAVAHTQTTSPATPRRSIVRRRGPGMLAPSGAPGADQGGTVVCFSHTRPRWHSAGEVVAAYRRRRPLPPVPSARATREAASSLHRHLSRLSLSLCDGLARHPLSAPQQSVRTGPGARRTPPGACGVPPCYVSLQSEDVHAVCTVPV
jgi:hypothetical protein